MSKYETTLRQIIYHFSQELHYHEELRTGWERDGLPVDVAEFFARKIEVRGTSIKFAPIDKYHDISVDERIEKCFDILVPPTLNFYNDEMRRDYYEIFCTENLMREIEYETVTYFLMKWKSNIKKCIRKYNALYAATAYDMDILNDYMRNGIIEDNDDVTHGKRTDTTGKGKTTHSVKTDGQSSGTNTTKTVFEDTPQSELLNSNYATNITKTGAETSNENTTLTTGGEDATSEGMTLESGKTERDYTRIIKELGRNKSVAQLIQEYMDNQTNIIENMVLETSKGLFMKIY